MIQWTFCVASGQEEGMGETANGDDGDVELVSEKVRFACLCVCARAEGFYFYFWGSGA